MTLASMITMLRIALIPLFMAAQWFGWLNGTVALGIFILASLTDSLDGYIARRYNQVSTFGKFIDPLADKLLVSSAILILVANGVMPAWVAMIVLARDFIVTSLRLVAVGGGRVISAHLSGKIRTIVNVIVIAVFLSPIINFDWWPDEIVTPAALAVMAAISIWSCADYIAKNWSVLDFKA
jgi:CDP-diacylglycerol--glycerol-3-phosphate 3-phosphatidyltransferase